MYFIQLLDYSILLKARHDKLISETITLHHHKLILKVNGDHEIGTQKTLKEKFSPPCWDLNQGFLDLKASVLSMGYAVCS